MVSGHYGNWELLGAGLAMRGYPITYYVGQQTNPAADAALNAVRRASGLGTVPKGPGIRALMRLLRAGKVLGLLADQHYSHQTHYIRFFGQPVSAAPGAASLALRTGARVMFCWSEPLGRYRYRAHFRAIRYVPSGDEARDVLALSQAISDSLEAQVRRAPAYYFWMHRRFRAQLAELPLTGTNRRFLAETAQARRRPAPLFLDRDGTLIEDVGYLSAFEQMRLLPGAAAAIARANAAGHPVVVVTNQSGVARGHFTEAFARESGDHLRALLATHGARIDGYHFAPDHPQGRPPNNVESALRKPGAGMVLAACRELGLEPSGAYMIGDKRSDVETGAHLGVIPVLVRTGSGRETERDLPADFAARGGRTFESLAEAIDWILAQDADKR
jgi:D-glycero-D-manno-heptose 1,7-bisphosphate phosphatase